MKLQFLCKSRSISPFKNLFIFCRQDYCQTLNPSARRHCLWASIHFPQAASPCSTMHSSLSFFVSGQAQHIFFLGFDSGGGLGEVRASLAAGGWGDFDGNGIPTSTLLILAICSEIRKVNCKTFKTELNHNAPCLIFRTRNFRVITVGERSS